VSYDPTLATDRDKVRALLGDTAATELLADEHIDAVLAWKNDFNTSVAFLAQELESHFATQPSSVSLPSGLSVSFARRTWANLIATLGGAVSYATFSVQPTRSDGYADYAAESDL
jgi:hypothetical protein